MVKPLGVTDLMIATALLVVAVPLTYFGYRGRLDTFTLRMTDINPLYWLFRWRYRSQPRATADSAFVRFFWRLNVVLLIGYVLSLAAWAIDLLILRR
jgi:hypothetical protein